MKRRTGKRNFTRLVLAALLTTGGLGWSSVASAEYSWNGLAVTDPISNDVGSIYYLNPASGEKSLKLITPGQISRTMVGGYVNGNTPLNGYTITLSSGDWTSIFGAWAAASSHELVSQNTVTVEGGVTQGSIFGGYSTGYGNVEKNTVNIKAGKVGYSATDGSEVAGLSICGGSLIEAGGNATGNNVNISGGYVNAAVYGAYADELSGNSNVTDNHVTITGGTVKAANGGIVGGQSSHSAANNNTVTISGGTITGTVIGGQSSYGGDANNNTVTISGGTIDGMVTGGMAMNGTASNNTVNILAAMTLAGVNGGSGNSGSNNTVNFAAKDITITDGIYGAENMNFYLPYGIASGDTMVTVNGGATYLTDTTIGVAALSGASLSKGDSVILLKNANGFTGTAATTTLTTPPKATSLTVNKSYKFTVTQNTNDVTATVSEESSGENEQAKSLVETRAAATTFVNAGADILASQGFTQAANAVAIETAANSKNGAAPAPKAGGFTPFAAFGGANMRAQSGSYVKTRGFGLNVGFARELSNNQGRLLFGPVVEYGGGNYDSHLDDGTRGDGKAHYFGIGIMARQVNHDGIYYEGSLRGGRVTSDYNGNLDGLGKVDYDSASNYFAMHLGAGKVFDLGKGNTLDGYLKFFYSHQASDDTTIHIAGADDERGSFDAVNSHRLRIGARLTHKINEKNSFYGGLAYQYEFDGDARATFNGNGAPSPSLKGSSGLLELGWQVKPGNGPVTLDFGVTGWAGKQRGGSVQLGATWEF